MLHVRIVLWHGTPAGGLIFGKRSSGDSASDTGCGCVFAATKADGSVVT